MACDEDVSEEDIFEQHIIARLLTSHPESFKSAKEVLDSGVLDVFKAERDAKQKRVSRFVEKVNSLLTLPTRL